MEDLLQVLSKNGSHIEKDDLEWKELTVNERVEAGKTASFDVDGVRIVIPAKLFIESQQVCIILNSRLASSSLIIIAEYLKEFSILKFVLQQA